MKRSEETVISIVQNGDVYEIRFPYDETVLDWVRQVQGRRWNPDGKFWTVPKDNIGFFIKFIKGTDYEQNTTVQSDEDLGINQKLETTKKQEIPDIDVSSLPVWVREGGHLFDHQVDCIKYSLGRKIKGNNNGFLLADSMGCISGECSVRIKEHGKKATRTIKLRNLYKEFKEDNTIEVKCLSNMEFHFFRMKDVVYSGYKRTVRVSLVNGDYIECTEDHLIYGENGWIESGKVKPGDKVFTNGVEQRCPNCGTTENIITSEHAKYRGYCRKCMYKLRKGKYPSDEILRRQDDNGYVLLYGAAIRKLPEWKLFSKFSGNGYGILEHQWVWYQNTGHVIDGKTEVIHHKNGIKNDNRFENLELISKHEHRMRHKDVSIRNLPQNSREFIVKNGKKIYYVPNLVEVESITYAGEQDVYDIQIDSTSVHNFVCNNIVVHNCGKTLEVINLALIKKEQEGAKHCLIICCVNSTKYNWKDDIELHTNGEFEGYILGSRLKRDGSVRLNGSGKEKLEDLVTGKKHGGKKKKSLIEDDELPYFLILNIESLHTKDMSLPRRDRYTMTNQIIKMINNGEISMIAIDEVHRNCSPQSTQGKQILEIKKHTGTKCEWIPMTGTPIVNKPTDAFLPLRLVEAHQNNSYYTWNRHFCIYGGYGGHSIIGYRNVPELKSILEPNMLRRTKEQVLDLPPKVHHVEYVENTKVQQKLYDEVRNDLLQHSESIAASLNPMSKLLRLRQVNGCPELLDESIDPKSKDYIKVNAKIQRLLELVADIYDSREKVVIFSNWLEPLRTAYRCLKREGYNICSYTGTMSAEDREENKHRFINDPNYNYPIIMGTIGALGTSHTLSVATNVIFLDMPWNQATLDQAEDRCYRLNTIDNVDIYFIITKDTVDERVYNIIKRKRGMSNYIVDNELDIRNNPELLSYLLSK